MRSLVLAVLTLCGCQSVDDTCDAGDVDCWFDHLEVTAEGLTVERFPGRTLGGGGTVPVEESALSDRAVLWAVGSSGTIVVSGEKGWSVQDSGTSITLRSVWAAALNDVWAGGDGELLHFDGVAWTRVVSGLDTITAISGSGVDDVWFAAGAGGLLHFDGAGFSSVSTGTSEAIWSVWVAARGEVWAGGAGGALFHLRASQWTRWPAPTSSGLGAIHGLSASDVFLASGALLRGVDGGFTAVTADLGLSALHANEGQVWAVAPGSRVVVHGPAPGFDLLQAGLTPNGVFFDGARAFIVEPEGRVEAYGSDGVQRGSSQAASSTTDLLAISGVTYTPAPTLRPRLTWDADAGVRLAPGASGKIPLGFEDPCGATPGVCVQVCSGSSRCSNGIVCTRAKRDDLVRGRMTLGVRYSAAPRPDLEALQVLIGVLDCGCSGCVTQLASDAGITLGGAVRVPVELEPLPAKQGPGGGTGGGTGGGGGTSSCGHCVTGQTCQACGSGATACGGKACCRSGETCNGSSCITSPTSGHGGATIQACGATARYTVQCPNGGCCPTCMTCNSDGTCSLP